MNDADFVERTFSDARGSRRYRLFIPKRRGRSMPFVVMLHGGGQSALEFAAGTRMNEVAEEYCAVVAYPEQSRMANSCGSWNWYLEQDQRRGSGEPALIAGITRRIMDDFDVDAARVYVGGMSSGGAAAAVMALAYPDLYAAACVHSGLASGAATGLISAFAAMQGGGRSRAISTGRPVPTIVFHGDRDHVVNHANTGQVVAQAAGNRVLVLDASEGRSVGGVSYTRNVRSEAGVPLVKLWVLHGAGHAWSGGSAVGSYTAPLGPDASREMMRFFLANPMTNRPAQPDNAATSGCRGQSSS